MPPGIAHNSKSTCFTKGVFVKSNHANNSLLSSSPFSGEKRGNLIPLGMVCEGGWGDDDGG